MASAAESGKATAAYIRNARAARGPSADPLDNAGKKAVATALATKSGILDSAELAW